MSIYDCEKVRIVFECTTHQKRKLKEYCRLKGITATTLLTLFIDELRISQMDESIRRNIAEQFWKIDNLFGCPQEPGYYEGMNDDRGNIKKSWFSKEKRVRR